MTLPSLVTTFGSGCAKRHWSLLEQFPSFWKSRQMSNSNHEESLTGLPHTPGGGGDSTIPPVAGIGATPVNAGAAAALEMVDTLEEGWGWLMLTASVSAALESGVAAWVLTTLSQTVALVEVCSGMAPSASKEMRTLINTLAAKSESGGFLRLLQERLLHAIKDLHQNNLNQPLWSNWK